MRHFLTPGKYTPAAWLLLFTAWTAGCSGRQARDYVPSEARSREAVVAMLDAWKAGDLPGIIEGTPAIQVGDTLRKPGQKLDSYEVLGELPSNDGRQFAVRARFSSPAAEEKINFVVVGIDPIWIFRQEDFDMVTHWEHKMSSPDKDGRDDVLSRK